jgi:hypothetical protein
MLFLIVALESCTGPTTTRVHVRTSRVMRSARIVSLASVAAFWALQVRS